MHANAEVHKTDSPLIPTSAAVPPPAEEQKQKPIVEEKRDGISEAPALASAPPAGVAQSVLSREEKIEYRDQDGNLLSPDQVKELEGKVSFKTRYETRTRLVDAQGNEINPPPEAAGVAPPHPDVEGGESSTIGKSEPDFQAEPASQRDVRADESKESSIERSNAGAASPASEANEATAN